MPPKWSPKPREIYRIDLAGAIRDLGWNATHRHCVVVDVHEGSVTVVFGAWEHDAAKCLCVEPGSPMAGPFGDWITKLTHFAAHNVARAPFDRIIEHLGEVGRDAFDAFDEVVQYAEIFSLKKTIN